MSFSSRIISTIRQISEAVEDDYLSLMDDAPVMEAPIVPKEEMIAPPVSPVDEVPAEPTPLHQDQLQTPDNQADAAREAAEVAALPGIQNSGLDLGMVLGESPILKSLLSQQ